VRGYPADGSGCDQIFEKRLATGFPGSVQPWGVTPAEIYYVYRWTWTGSYHLSSQGGARIPRNGKYAEVAAFVEQRANAGEIPRGHIALQPCWRIDYLRLAAMQIAALAERRGEGEKEVSAATGESLRRTSTLEPTQGG